MAADHILGAVLAGGASSRFGSDKALAVIGGKTLLEHARDALAGVVDEVVVVGRDGGVRDRPAAGMGPLGGIAGALDHGARHGFAGVLTIGCDMPAVPAALLAALLDHAPAFCADAPVLGHWPTTLAAGLLGYLDRLTPSPLPSAGIHRRPAADHGGEEPPWMLGQARHDGGKLAGLSVRRWAESIGAVAIASPVPLGNVNTPADLPS